MSTLISGAERSKLLEVACRLMGTPYDDSHGGGAWKELSTRPEALDCSTFVCRVAAEAGLYPPGLLVPDAAWLLDHLVVMESPAVGDIIGYCRPALAGTSEGFPDVVWHLMIYAGTGRVVGACDFARKVVMRPLEYEPEYGERQWRLVDPPPFRALRVIF